MRGRTSQMKPWFVAFPFPSAELVTKDAVKMDRGLAGLLGNCVDVRWYN